MKKIYLIILFFLHVYSVTSFAQRVVFSYDESGNQKERKWLCINCLARGGASVTTYSMENNPLIEDAIALEGKNRMVKANPNPVSETLNVTWKVGEKNVFLKTIEVYSISGVKMFGKSFDLESSSTQISFATFAPGSYLLHISYSDQQREIIKIIKL